MTKTYVVRGISQKYLAHLHLFSFHDATDFCLLGFYIIDEQKVQHRCELKRNLHI